MDSILCLNAFHTVFIQLLGVYIIMCRKISRYMHKRCELSILPLPAAPNPFGPFTLLSYSKAHYPKSAPNISNVPYLLIICTYISVVKCILAYAYIGACVVWLTIYCVNIAQVLDTECVTQSSTLSITIYRHLQALSYILNMVFK